LDTRSRNSRIAEGANQAVATMTVGAPTKQWRWVVAFGDRDMDTMCRNQVEGHSCLMCSRHVAIVHAMWPRDTRPKKIKQSQGGLHSFPKQEAMARSLFPPGTVHKRSPHEIAAVSQSKNAAKLRMFLPPDPLATNAVAPVSQFGRSGDSHSAHPARSLATKQQNV
jgi:hypothetical protein